MSWEEWDKYCRCGRKGCMATRCPCVDTHTYRYMNARARGFSVLKSVLYSLFPEVFIER